MDRRRVPTEFGFTTSPYVPPERPRPFWRTVLIGALLAFIPIVGPGISAVYIDRRNVPGAYEFAEALKTAVIQVVAVAILALVFWFILAALFGFTVQINPQFTRTGG